jgi:hypothetical protein
MRYMRYMRYGEYARATRYIADSRQEEGDREKGIGDRR